MSFPATEPLATDAGIVVDVASWPIVVTSFPRRAMTDADLRGYIDSINELLRRHEKFVQVIDTLAIGATTLDARQRRMMADWLDDPEARRLSVYKIADVLIIRSAIVRGATTAVFWLRPPASPTKSFASGDEALAWVKTRCAEENVALTPANEARMRRIDR